MSRSIGLCIASTLLSTTAAASQADLGQSTLAPTRPKNILIIVLDDLGTDKLGFYGETPTPCQPGTCTPCSPSPYPITPNLNQLRSKGILFTNAYGNPLCSPTRACIQTGRHGFRTGVGTITGPGTFELSDSEVFLPELLRDGFPPGPPFPVGLPYQRAVFGKWHLTTSTGNESHAVDNGYQRYYGSISNVWDYFDWTKIEHDAGSPPVSIPIDGSTTIPPYSTDTWHGSVTSRDALQWINAQSNAFLACVCFGPPHFPLQVPPLSLVSTPTRTDLGCSLMAPLLAGDVVDWNDPPWIRRLVYRAMIEAVDTEIGNLINGMDAAKRANTMIFVIGDNGTEPELLDDPPHAFSHGKFSVYEWGVRVPLIVAGPMLPLGIPIGGFTSAAPVNAVDLWSTVAAITGADENLAAPQWPLDSISFLPVIQNPAYPGDREFAFSQSFQPNGVLQLPPPSCYSTNRRSLSNGTHKYLRLQNPLTPCAIPTYVEHFFDISADREEANDLIGTTDPALLAILNQMRAEMTVLSGQ